MVLRVKHYKDLVHAELLDGRHLPCGLLMGTALESDGLTPVVAPGLNTAVRRDNGVVAGGRRGDH